MYRTTQIFLLFFFSFFSFSLSAQSFASVSNTNKVDLDFITMGETGADWSFYIDEENKIYYLDFEKLNFNLSEIVVKNGVNEIIMREDVLDLPVNTIFELNLADFPHGEYQVELRSFTGVMTKKIIL